MANVTLLKLKSANQVAIFILYYISLQLQSKCTLIETLYQMELQP